MYHTLVLQEHDFKLVPSQFHDHSGSQTAASIAQVDNKPKDGGASTNELGELKKLDSFGRWMDKEIGGDCDDSLMASDSGNYWNTLGTENEDKEVSSLSHHMQLDIESLGPSLSQEQLFSIRDFSPDWAYSGVETKVCALGPGTQPFFFFFFSYLLSSLSLSLLLVFGGWAKLFFNYCMKLLCNFDK